MQNKPYLICLFAHKKKEKKIYSKIDLSISVLFVEISLRVMGRGGGG